MAAIGTRVPPELFTNILSFVGDSSRLRPREDPTERQEEMKHLSACALTCVYWAQLTRPRMFSGPVLRSAEDLRELQSFISRRASASTRIEPIGRFIQRPTVFYKLGDHLWFLNLGGLKVYGAHELTGVDLHISDTVPPGNFPSNTQRPILHPLFYPAPRVLPLTANLDTCLYVENIHFTALAVLFNLLQDCLLLNPRRISCTNLTWVSNPSATPSSIGFTIACRQDYVTTLECTDNVLVASMVQGISQTPYSLRRQIAQLCLTDSTHLLDVMRATQGATPGEFRMHSYSQLTSAQLRPRLPTVEGNDLYLGWTCLSNNTSFQFYCVASRDTLDTQVHYVARIVVDLRCIKTHTDFSIGMKAVDWSQFVHGARKFTHLRELDIVLYDWPYEQGSRESLSELVACLLEVSPQLKSLLKLWSDDTRAGDVGWTSIELETVLKDIEMTRQGLRVNAILSSSSYTKTPRPFVWDLRDSPPDITPRPSSHEHPSELTAIIPPDNYLEICCTQLPWKFKVTHLDTGRFSFVTVGDVMKTLYKALGVPISKEEFQSVCGANARHREKVVAAYERRVARAKSPGDERVKGICRIDLLGTDYIFAGLAGAKSDTNPRIPTLILHVSSAA